MYCIGIGQVFAWGILEQATSLRAAATALNSAFLTTTLPMKTLQEGNCTAWDAGKHQEGRGSGSPNRGSNNKQTKIG